MSPSASDGKLEDRPDRLRGTGDGEMVTKVTWKNRHDSFSQESRLVTKTTERSNAVPPYSRKRERGCVEDLREFEPEDAPS